MAIPFNSAEIMVALTSELAEAREVIATEFVKDIVPRTPVDTGHARRNWQVNWGVPTGNELPGVDKAGSDTVTSGVSKVRTGRNRNPFLPVVIENNVPYIGRLNAGSSKQAPANFVELSIVVAINRLKARKEI